MDDTSAYRLLASITPSEQSEAAAERLPVFLMTMLMALQGRVNNDDGDGYELEPGEAEATYAALEMLRATLDEVERDLLRFMRWASNGGEGMTLQQVADDLGSRYGGRQGVQKRWKRLTAADRMTTSRNYKVGAAVGKGAGTVNAATTPED